MSQEQPTPPADQHSQRSPARSSRHHSRSSHHAHGSSSSHRRRSRSRDRDYDHYRDRRRRSRSPYQNHRSPAYHHHPQTRPTGCWACPNPAIPGKTACEACFLEATKEKQADGVQVVSLMKQVFQETLREFSRSTQPHQSTAVPDPVIIQPGPSGECSSAARDPVASDHSENSASDNEPEQAAGFDFSLVQPFVKAVRQALAWEDSAEPPERKKKYFSHIKKEFCSFPFIEELKDVLMEEWNQVDKKSSFKNRFAKLYPFKREDVKFLEDAPTVDAALMRLARHVTLPLDDAVSFKDVLDRRIDLDLKKIYLLAGGACKPSMAVAATSKALEAWTDALEAALPDGLDKPEISAPLRHIRLSAMFIAEASIDMIKSLSRIMLAAVTGRRALWLRPWVADPSSKQGWCRIPFEGHSLFGDKLDAAIAKATGGKSGFIPQDRNLMRQKPTFFNRNRQDRYREARSYKPGKAFRRPWRSTFFSAKQKKNVPAPVPDSRKSF